jgi:preprotein translocase subunit YajC
MNPTPTPTAPAEGFTIFGLDPLMIGLIVILAVMVFFMWRNSRKRKTEQEQLKSTMVPGVEVMTNFGLFGRIVTIDEVANQAELEIAPGTVIKVHRQTLVRIVDQAVTGEPRSVEEAMEIANREAAERETTPAPAESDEPKFGERIKSDESDEDDKDSKKS